MPDLDKLFEELKDGLSELAKGTFEEYKDGILADGKDFLNSIKPDLEKWALQVAAGEMSKKDFEWLVNSRKDLAELTALKEIGLAKVTLDQFTNDLVDMVIGKVLGAVL